MTDAKKWAGRIRDDATESRAKLQNIDNGVEEVLDVLRPITLAIDNLQPEFHIVSRSRPLETDLERERMASGLWTSIATVSMDMDVDQANCHSPAPTPERPLEDDSHIHSRILEGLDFEDMTTREIRSKTLSQKPSSGFLIPGEMPRMTSLQIRRDRLQNLRNGSNHKPTRPLSGLQATQPPGRARS